MDRRGAEGDVDRLVNVIGGAGKEPDPYMLGSGMTNSCSASPNISLPSWGRRRPRQPCHRGEAAPGTVPDCTNARRPRRTRRSQDDQGVTAPLEGVEERARDRCGHLAARSNCAARSAVPCVTSTGIGWRQKPRRPCPVGIEEAQKVSRGPARRAAIHRSAMVLAGSVGERRTPRSRIASSTPSRQRSPVPGGCLVGRCRVSAAHPPARASRRIPDAWLRAGAGRGRERRDADGDHVAAGGL